MKTIHRLLILLLAAAVTCGLCALSSSCTQTTVKTTDPVTGAVTETTTKAPSKGVLPFAAAAIVAYSPRPIVVREEKSAPNVWPLLCNRQPRRMAFLEPNQRKP